MGNFHSNSQTLFLLLPQSHSVYIRWIHIQLFHSIHTFIHLLTFSITVHTRRPDSACMSCSATLTCRSQQNTDALQLCFALTVFSLCVSGQKRGEGCATSSPEHFSRGFSSREKNGEYSHSISAPANRQRSRDGGSDDVSISPDSLDGFQQERCVTLQTISPSLAVSRSSLSKAPDLSSVCDFPFAVLVALIPFHTQPLHRDFRRTEAGHAAGEGQRPLLSRGDDL